MDHLVAHPRNGYIVLKENVQDLSHPADVLLSLLARFHDEHPVLLRDTLSSGWGLLKSAFAKLESLSVSEFKVALRESEPNWKENWRKHGGDLLRQLRKHGSPILLIIDELPTVSTKQNPSLVEATSFFSSSSPKQATNIVGSRKSFKNYVLLLNELSLSQAERTEKLDSLGLEAGWQKEECLRWKDEVLAKDEVKK